MHQPRHHSMSIHANPESESESDRSLATPYGFANVIVRGALGRPDVCHFPSNYTARRTSSSLILPIALFGLRPLGHTSTQFIIEWQRNKRYGSSRLSKRSAVASSRLSAIKRYACNKPAGPTNLSGFHQNDGHEVEQHAHNMHSYKPSNSSRSAGICRRSFSGGMVVLTKYGLIE